MTHLKKLTCTATVVAAASLLAGCATWGEMDRSERGLAVGATGGAVVGAAVGGPVGAAVGAAAGGYTGHHQGYPLREQGYYGSAWNPTSYAAYEAEIVRDAQASLADRGYRPGAIDGRWGPNTQGAVLHFQRVNGLRQTAVLDRPTLYALGITP
jgi:phage tail tape-measure protein